MCSGRPTWPAPPSAYTSGTTNELNLADWARANHVEVKPLVFDQNEETRNAYNAGRCDAFTTDASQLAGIRTALRDPSESTSSCPTSSPRKPLAVAVRQGDDQWFDIVRWTVFALFEAEEARRHPGQCGRDAEQPEPGHSPPARPGGRTMAR